MVKLTLCGRHYCCALTPQGMRDSNVSCTFVRVCVYVRVLISPGSKYSSTFASRLPNEKVSASAG